MYTYICTSLSQQTPPAWRACMCGVWCVWYVLCVVCGVWCVWYVWRQIKAKRHTQTARKGPTQKAHAKDTDRVRDGGRMSRRVSHAANLRHVDDERIRRDAYVSAHFYHPLIHGHHMYISQQSPKPASRVITRSSHAYIALKSKACTAH